MQILTEKECIEKIENGQPFHAEIKDCAFSLKIEEYSFFICTAIHNGHNLRDSLKNNCLLNSEERLYEEDPYTGQLISQMPISIIVHDSRYEYDLNRSPEECIYVKAWGKEVWKTDLSITEKNLSQRKHTTFYNILKTLVKELEKKHGSCLIYDIHTYNHLRIKKDTPVFNVGTVQTDTLRWSKTIKTWISALNKSELPDIVVRASENEVFFGRGFLAGYIKKNFNNTLVLSTEIKKVFMDEKTGKAYPVVFKELKNVFQQAIISNSLHFSIAHL